MPAKPIRRRILLAIIVANLVLVSYSAVAFLLKKDPLVETFGLRQLPELGSGEAANLIVTLDPASSGAEQLDRLAQTKLQTSISVTIVVPATGGVYGPTPRRWPAFHVVEIAPLDRPEQFHWNAWYLLDAGGRLKRRGELVGDGLVGALADELGGLDKSAVALVRFASTIDSPSRSTSPDRSRARVIMFLRRGGSACPIAKILRLLNGRPDLLEQRDVSIALPSVFSDGDVSAFLDTYRPVMPTWRVSAAIDRRWLELESIYGEPAFGAFVAIYNENGSVTVLTDPSAVLRAFGGNE